MIEIEEINSFEQLQGIEKDWKNLISMTKANSIFLTYEWINIWWRHFGNEKRLLILVLRDNSEVIGIVPLMIVNSDTVLPARTVKFIGTDPQSNASLFSRTLGFGSRYGTVGYMDFMLQEDHRAYLISCVIEFLLGRADSWDVIDLQGLSSSTDTHTVLGRALADTSFICRKRIPSTFYYLPVTGSIKTYWDGLAKKTRKNLRQSKRRLEKNGKLDFPSYRDLREIKETLPDIMRLEQKSWKGQKAVGPFSGDDRTRNFHIELAEHFADLGWFDLSLLTLDNKIIAYLANFVYNNTFYEYSTAYDPDFSYYSPGMVLQWQVISRSFDSQIEEMDFMPGSSRLKSVLRFPTRDYIQLMIFKKNLYSKLLHAIEFRIKPGFKKVKTTVSKKN